MTSISAGQLIIVVIHAAQLSLSLNLPTQVIILKELRRSHLRHIAMSSKEGGQIGQALVDFSLHGIFPDEDISSRRISAQDLAPALASLETAKIKLEVFQMAISFALTQPLIKLLQSDIHKINEETAPDVDQWITNAKSLEDDINRSRTWANDILRRSQAPDVSGKAIEEAEAKVKFLQQEVEYSQQVHLALGSIKHVNGLLDQVEQARDERRILDSLHLLESKRFSLLSLSVADRFQNLGLGWTQFPSENPAVS